MIITDIKKDNERSKKSRIFIDGEYSFTLYNGEVKRFAIKKGEVLCDDTYEHIMKDVLIKRARSRSLYLLAKRDYTENRLKRKLIEGGYPTNVIENAVSYVKELGYINDERFAESYLRSKGDKLSKRMMLKKMYEKGIPKEIAENAYLSFAAKEEVNEREMIRDYLIKKNFDAQSADQKDRERMMGRLVRKGFSINDIIACFNLT